MICDERGVLDLPLRLLVTLVVGAAALSIILYYIFTPCWFPEHLQVQWHPLVINADEEEKIVITVMDSHGNPVSRASVIVSGLGNASSNKTINNGTATLEIQCSLPSYRNEGYLDISVHAPGCYEKFFQENAIKVVKGE
ncbi:MAG TPA: hypothetical protein ENG06_05650 [Thermoplasmatales archaeon]|nr:MAG: hypothetical protein DRN07_07340 [Thermoplasmata archaeon]RLF54640.1 MAG: hypothetical protein DRN37_10005 [Thermoplasmata archaeon]HDN51240.1 hypothetical protein [Thermoplasmatales archaeon]